MLHVLVEAIVASTGALYGIIGALGAVVVGGGLYVAQQNGAFGPSSTTSALTAPAATPPAPAPAAPQPQAAAPPAAPPSAPAPTVVVPRPAPPPAPAGLSAGQREQLRLLVLDGRRAITRGDFAAAERALAQAEHIDSRSSDVIAARRDLREAQQRASRDHADGLVAQARNAIARHDFATADRLLEQGERLDARDPEVIAARRELREAQRQAGRDPRYIDGLVAQARTAMARRDYATADRLLDQAEAIDQRDRDVQQARAELNAAQRPAPERGPVQR